MTMPSALAQDAINIRIGYQRVKRATDVFLTLLILFPLIIIMIVVAVLILLDSQGPIFFKQKRVGIFGTTFTLLKFRTMHHQCNDALHRQAIERYMADQAVNEHAMAAGLRYKLVNDLRVTRVGRFLRKSCIDELPQFFNVLRGDMTLVGPRPPLPYEVERYAARDMLRLSGKPGLTGTWQVYGRGRVPFSTMVEMDIDYLQKQSPWLDLKLIMLTLPVMLQGTGGA